MELSEMVANRGRELTERKLKLEEDIAALRKELAEIDVELGAIAAYDDHMARRTEALDVQVRVRMGRGEITRDAVLTLVRDRAGDAGLSRSEIIQALGVKGDRSREIAVDNRLRELKREGRVLHEGRNYRVLPLHRHRITTTTEER